MMIMRKTLVILIWSVVIGALFISIFYVIVSGVTSYFIYPTGGSILKDTTICKPVWVSIGLFSVDEICLKYCEERYDVKSYKIEKLKCFCDLNNCNPRE
jgi:hypothetical protein